MLTKKIILFTILLIFLGCSNKKIGHNKQYMSYQEMQFSRTQERYSSYFDIIYESDSLALTIQTNQQEFIQGEPLKIILSLKNISKEPLNVNDELELGYSTCPITLCLIDADGVYYDLYYGIHIDKGRNVKYEANGTKIAFSSQKPGEYNQIWVMDSDGSNLRQLTTKGGTYPGWSPDGSKIVYVRESCYEYSSEHGTLWIMDADGSNKRQLTVSPVQ